MTTESVPLNKTKHVLLTKDEILASIQIATTVSGNGIGMKIVGGKMVPGTNDVGAFVTRIHPGGVADQLHGELQEGTRILLLLFYLIQFIYFIYS